MVSERSRMQWHVPAAAVTLGGILAANSCPAFSATDPDPPPKVDYSVNVSAVERTGVRLRAPATLRLTGVNQLRYRCKLGVAETISPGPDLRLPFLATLPVVPEVKVDQPDASQESPGKGPKAGLPGAFDETVSSLSAAQSQLQTLVAGLKAKRETVAGAAAKLDAVVRGSDAILASDGAGTVLDLQVKALAPVVQESIQLSWPYEDVETQSQKVAELKQELAGLQDAFPNTWKSWYTGKNRLDYERALRRAEQFRLVLASLAADKLLASSFEAMKSVLIQWSPILGSLKERGAQAYTLDDTESLAFAFFNTRTAKVELVMRDRLAPESAAVIRQEIATIERTTPFSVSSGIALSLLNEDAFELRSATKPASDPAADPVAIKLIRQTKDKKEQILPVVLLNTRLFEWSESVAAHVSIGSAVNLNSGSVGDHVEFVAGLSLSFSRGLFMTSGIHLGRASKLANGRRPEDEVAVETNEPPLVEESGQAWFLAFSARIK